LTNSNGCDNIQPNLLLTAPRFVPAFLRNSVCFRLARSCSLPAIQYPLSPTLYFHALTNPSSRLIDFQVLYFHTVTNPFSCNPFPFTSIQNARVSPADGCIRDFGVRFVSLSQISCFQHLADSLFLFGLFFACLPFVFNTLRTPLRKYRGGGYLASRRPPSVHLLSLYMQCFRWQAHN
jgi:hypothetical protein